MYGVTLVTIVLAVIVVQLVGHEAGHLFSKVSQGLAR
jgi:fatty acid desaturase